MEELLRIPNAFACAAAGLPDGWFAAALVLADPDPEFLERFERNDIAFRDGKTEEDWSRAFVSAPRRLVLAATGQETQVLAEADRIESPAVCDADEPVVAWAERREDVWRLVLRRGGEARSLIESNAPLRRPAVSLSGGKALVGYACDGGNGPTVRVCDESGGVVFETPGHRPVMAGGPDGAGLLVVERPSPNRVGLAAVELLDGEVVREIDAPRLGDYNFNAHVFADAEENAYHLVWEACPCWGLDERVGLYRELCAWDLGPEDLEFRPSAGTCGGRLYTPPEAFQDRTPHNFVPVRPRALRLGDGLAVAFRRFRYRGHKGFGWDTMLVRQEEGGWSGLTRLSPNPGPPDGAYEVLACNGDLVGFFPCCDQTVILTFEEAASGRNWHRRSTDHCRDHRVEVVGLGAEEGMAPTEYPARDRAIFVIPPPRPNVAPEPPSPPVAPEGRTLIWADLHAHSAYSKCMSGNDGLPEDVLRFQRDALGLRVLCLTEHVEYLSAPEFAHVLDSVEREAGDTRVPIYGVEWSRFPAHHTNFYAADREVFDRLRALLLACEDLRPLCVRIRRELPEASVAVIRHMHGRNEDDFGVSGPRVTETHDPEVEWAMEGMQTRGLMMLEPKAAHPLFPTNFLNAGARVGVIGGSDHSRGVGTNAFCLTGLWVREATGAGVLEAIRGRKTLGSANGKIALYATLGESPGGEVVDVEGPVRVRVHYASQTPVLRATLLRDGELLEWVEVNDTTGSVELVDERPQPGAHWYAVTVEAEATHPKGPVVAHLSPFFVEVT